MDSNESWENGIYDWASLAFDPNNLGKCSVIGQLSTSIYLSNMRPSVPILKRSNWLLSITWNTWNNISLLAPLELQEQNNHQHITKVEMQEEKKKKFSPTCPLILLSLSLVPSTTVLTVNWLLHHYPFHMLICAITNNAQGSSSTAFGHFQCFSKDTFKMVLIPLSSTLSKWVASTSVWRLSSVTIILELFATTSGFLYQKISCCLCNRKLLH